MSTQREKEIDYIAPIELSILNNYFGLTKDEVIQKIKALGIPEKNIIHEKDFITVKSPFIDELLDVKTIYDGVNIHFFNDRFSVLQMHGEKYV